MRVGGGLWREYPSWRRDEIIMVTESHIPGLGDGALSPELLPNLLHQKKLSIVDPGTEFYMQKELTLKQQCGRRL